MSATNETMKQAVMPTYGRADIAFVRGEGSWLYAENGDAYLDCASGIAVNIFGHNNPRLVEALTQQASRLWHTSNLYRIPQQEKLAYRLAQHAGLDQAFFCNSGVEANEAAVKMARRFQYRAGYPDRIKIICAGGAFHGRTLAMLAATDKELFREGFGPMPDGFSHAPFGNLNALRDMMSEDVAAIMVEPVQGEGGARAAPDGYLDGLAEAAQEYGTLVIADEVQCGLGRTGKFFAFQHSTVQPDIVVLAKGLGGGMPIGAVITRADIGEAMGPGSHGSTFGGNPLATACGNAVLDGLEQEGFIEGVQHKIGLLDTVMMRLHRQFQGMILEVRGAGFLRGLRLHDDVPAGEVTAALRARHLLVVPAADNVLRLLPPLTITEDEIHQAEGHLVAHFEDLSAGRL